MKLNTYSDFRRYFRDRYGLQTLGEAVACVCLDREAITAEQVIAVLELELVNTDELWDEHIEPALTGLEEAFKTVIAKAKESAR